MTLPRSESQLQHDDATTPAGHVTSRSEAVPIAIEWDHDGECGFSILFRGALQSDAPAASGDPDVSVAAHETGARVLSGSVRGEAAGVALNGEILAATFDGPEPAITLDGEGVDPSRWPSVEAYTESVAGQEPVADPFPDRGMLGKPLGDPLAPERHEVRLDGGDGESAQSFSVEVDGEFLDRPDGATVSDDGAVVTGELDAGETATVAIEGVVTWIETDGGIDVSVVSRD